MIDLTSRRDAFETKFAHEELLRFKAFARRNNLLGLWAARRLGKSGAEAEEYAKSMLLAGLEDSADENVIRKIQRDFEGAGRAIAEPDVRQMFDQLWSRAIDEIKSGNRLVEKVE